jgi:cobalt-zinc-cadmium efflux system membrane fusion protein
VRAAARSLILLQRHQQNSLCAGRREAYRHSENAMNDNQISSSRRGFGAWLRRSGPTLLVLALLGGVAVWGHETGWTLPRFSSLVGLDSATKDDWCEEHAVPESICVECNDSLMPRLKATYCKVHGVHYCPFERPEVVQLKTPSVVSAADLEQARRALELKERPENNPRCKLVEKRVQFASKAVCDKMGIEPWPVERGSITETVTASGEIVFEQPRVAPIATPVPGRVWFVTEKGSVGQTVRRGDVLALVESAEIGKTKAEFLHAIVHLDLKTKALSIDKTLATSGAVSQAKLNEMEAARREAEICLLSAQQALANLGLSIAADEVKNLSPEDLNRRLQFLGLPAELARRLDAKTSSANLYPVVASQGGVVTSARVVAGEVVDATKPLFVVTDTSRMWLVLNVRLEDVRFLRVRDPKTNAPGQTVRFRPDGGTRKVTGELVWRSTHVDEKTRSVQYRAELPNPDGSLLANTFGIGEVVLREEKEAIVVPSEAVHWEGDCHIVFVQDKDFHTGLKVYHVRSVRPGVTTGGKTEIIAGLLPGEAVATRNSANLRAELLKNRLGAG